MIIQTRNIINVEITEFQSNEGIFIFHGQKWLLMHLVVFISLE